jgi:hypothetical protein
MIALIDYDNIHEIHRRRGLQYVAQRIADAVGSTPFATDPHLRMRLYGGWFEEVRTTRRAQSVAADLAGFPVSITVTDTNGQVTIIASGDFAVGLIDEPRVALTHTFRPRAGPGSIVCTTRPAAKCANPTACPLAALDRLLVAHTCPGAGCAAIPEDLLERPEQKLVDTLLVADLISLAALAPQPRETVAVVSNDDDMWPGIRLALLRGLQVVHIHPVPRRSTPTHYLVAMPSGYRQATLN